MYSAEAEQRERDQQAIIDERETFIFTEGQLVSMLQGSIELYLEYRLASSEEPAREAAIVEVLQGLKAEQQLADLQIYKRPERAKVQGEFRMICRKAGCCICSERKWGSYGKYLNPRTKLFVYYWLCGWCRNCISVPRVEVWPKLPNFEKPQYDDFELRARASEEMGCTCDACLNVIRKEIEDEAKL